MFERHVDDSTVEQSVLFLLSGQGELQPGAYYTGHIVPLRSLREVLGSSVEVAYDKGCEVLGDDGSGVPAGVAAATGADLASVFVGGRPVCSRFAAGASSTDVGAHAEAELAGPVQPYMQRSVIVVKARHVRTPPATVEPSPCK
jgi:hypothetical protein